MCFFGILLAGDVETHPGPMNRAAEEITAASKHLKDLKHPEEDSLAATWKLRFLVLEKKTEAKYHRLEAELDEQKQVYVEMASLCKLELFKNRQKTRCDKTRCQLITCEHGIHGSGNSECFARL